MSGLRFNLDCYVDEDPQGKEVTISGVKLKLPPNFVDAIPQIRDAVRKLKSFSSKINEGKDNEEMTIVAKYHVCYHQEGIKKRCGPNEEI